MRWAVAALLAGLALCGAANAQPFNTIRPITCPGSQWINSISVALIPSCAQPAIGDISGASAVAASGSASDLTSGTLPAARLPALTGAVTTSVGSAATAFGVLAANTVLANSTNASAIPIANAFPASTENRLCNGDFLIDQFNAGAAVTPGSGNIQVLDCWKSGNGAASKATYQQQTTSGPNLLQYWLKVLSTSAYAAGAAEGFNIHQRMEGRGLPDSGYGTAQARTMMLTFYVQSSLTGNLACWAWNVASTRSIVFTVPIAQANTWTYEAYALVGDTVSGITPDANVEFEVGCDLGSGSTFETATLNVWQASLFTRNSSAIKTVATNAATLGLANVRLRFGTYDVPYTAKPFDQVFSEVRRYFKTSFSLGTAPAQSAGLAGATCTKNPIAAGDPSAMIQLDNPMRSSPVIVTYNPSAANANWRDVTAAADVTVSVDPGTAKGTTGFLLATSATVATLGDILCIHYSANSSL